MVKTACHPYTVKLKVVWDARRDNVVAVMRVLTRLVKVADAITGLVQSSDREENGWVLWQH